MEPIITRTVTPPREDDGTRKCPACGGLGSDMTNGGFDSVMIGTDKDGNSVIERTHYPCGVCNGKGRVKNCTACKGSGIEH